MPGGGEGAQLSGVQSPVPRKWMRGSVSQKGVSAVKTPGPPLTARGQRYLPLPGSWSWVTWEGRPAPRLEPPGINVPITHWPSGPALGAHLSPSGCVGAQGREGQGGKPAPASSPGATGVPREDTHTLSRSGTPGGRPRVASCGFCAGPTEAKGVDGAPLPPQCPPLSHCLRLFLTRQSLRLQS